MDKTNRQSLVISLCGLPARGKTYLSRTLNRYLVWLGYNARVFNIGHYRRSIVGTSTCKADFFDPSNEEANAARELCAKEAFEDLINFLKTGGNVAIFDGTNTTAKRRMNIRKQLSQELPEAELIWLESICNDDVVIEDNIKKAKLNSPDYAGVDPEQAATDFRRRIENYQRVYETIDSKIEGDDISYIKIIDIGRQILMRNINGFLPCKIVSFLMNLHVEDAPLYLVRAGECTNTRENRIGGDTDLTEEGKQYAEMLKTFFEEEKKRGDLRDFKPSQIKIFTSTMVRANSTVERMKQDFQLFHMKNLDEINVGLCDGMTHEQVRREYPLPENMTKHDLILHQFPRGESYADLIERLEPVIHELQRSKTPVIVVSHHSVLKCLAAYFAKHEIDEIPNLEFPLNCIVKMRPDVYHRNETRYILDPITGQSTIQETQQKDLLVKDFRLL